jgi:hypothetical protein
LVRVGLPIAGGQLAEAARLLGAPVMISANALARRWPRADRAQRPFPGFRPPPESLHGLDIALDSAGFVAMSLHNGYPWSVGAYYDLVASHPFTWHAAMDCCCEPEVARDADAVALRIAETARLYGLCRAEARHRGLSDPVPVLQGWHPDDYLRCLDLLPIADWPDLVGVGSMCRRHLPGLVAVVDRLDRALPGHVGLHLFGVKSAGIDLLRSHPRIVSVDSQAWDAGARMRHGGCPPMPVRIDALRAWYARQLQGRPAPRRPAAPVPPARGAPAIPEAWLDLVAGNEIEATSLTADRIWMDLLEPPD